jgi:hypothetical protein
MRSVVTRLLGARERVLELPKLVAKSKEAGVLVRVVSKPAWLYLQTKHMPPDQLDIDALDDEARRLPDVFALADEWIAEPWQK